jgi:hypothetical protein
MIGTTRSTRFAHFLSQARWDDPEISDRGTLGVIAACLAALAILSLSGCSVSSQARAVDPPRAGEALKTALDHWKSGGDPKSLQSSSTPMTAQDYEWASGVKLIDYQIVDDGKDEATNLRVQVKLTLSNPAKGQAKTIQKQASYVIGTSPSVTVFRDVIRH